MTLLFDLELNSQSLNAQPTYQVDQGEPVQYMRLLQSGQRSLWRAEAVAVYQSDMSIPISAHSDKVTLQFLQNLLVNFVYH